ncbi:MAG TPA: hypothetical protein VHH73_08775 [Verrucomicrobiae bacterium]|nr:hypothetical protein [Verrucomicrobiae bacterium]
MRTSFNRRTATKVKDGRVQRKNRHLPTVLQGYVLDRESPGKGFRHVLTKRDLQAFVDLIPDFPRLSQRLERIVLAAPAEDWDGAYQFYHREKTGAIFLNAWREDLWVDLSIDYFDAHETIFSRLGVSHDRCKEAVTCRFTESQARAFMLLHVFMHELGHHHDRTHQKHLGASRGEDYAERFATSRFDLLFPSYRRTFGDPIQANSGK